MLEVEVEVPAKIAKDVVEGVKAAVGGVVVGLAEVGLLLCLAGRVEEAAAFWVHQQLQDWKEKET